MTKARMDGAVGSLGWWEGYLLHPHWNQMGFRAPSNPNHPMAQAEQHSRKVQIPVSNHPLLSPWKHIDLDAGCAPAVWDLRPCPGVCSEMLWCCMLSAHSPSAKPRRGQQKQKQQLSRARLSRCHHSPGPRQPCGGFCSAARA